MDITCQREQPRRGRARRGPRCTHKRTRESAAADVSAAHLWAQAPQLCSHKVPYPAPGTLGPQRGAPGRLRGKRHRRTADAAGTAEPQRPSQRHSPQAPCRAASSEYTSAPRDRHGTARAGHWAVQRASPGPARPRRASRGERRHRPPPRMAGGARPWRLCRPQRARIRRQRACPRPPAIRAAAQPAAALARARRRPLASLQRAPSATGSKAGFLFVALFVECLFFQGLPQTSSWRGHGTWSSPIIAITPLRQPSASDAVGQGVQEEQKGQGC